MASPGTQPDPAIDSQTKEPAVFAQSAFDSGPQTAATPSLAVPSVSNAHRWVDLALVLSTAFLGAIAGSLYLAFHPVPPTYSNMRLIAAILSEATSLSLFLVLFARQGRQIKDIGFGFRWTDLSKAIGLFLTASFVMWFVNAMITYAWFFWTRQGPQWLDTRGMFAGISLWLVVPFLMLNPFFEEMLVRGYLTTEVIDLRKSVWLATLVSLALQTSYHLYYGVLGALIVGSGLAVFALYYAKSRRLMPVILAHMFWDLSALLRVWHR